MNHTDHTPTGTSITLFRELIADLQFDQLNELQLCDLSAVAAGTAEGLCHGILYLAESLENHGQISVYSQEQVSLWLNACAHVLPALFELNEQANNHLLQMRPSHIYIQH